MSEQRMSLDHAKTIATGYGAHMVNEVRAARTIVACGDVLDRLGHEYRKAHNSEPHPYGWTAGYLHALDVAEQWLKEALNPSSAN